MLDIIDWLVLAALGKQLWSHAAIISFGGSKGKSSSTEKINQTTTSNPWDVQSPYLQKGFQDATSWLNSSATPNANLQAGWDNMLSQVGQMGQVANTAAQGNQWLGSIAQLDPSTNPYLQANLDIMAQQVNQQLGQGLNQVNQQAAGAGMFGGARQGVAQGLALEGAQNAIQQGSAQMLMDNYNRGAQNMLQSQQLAGQVGSGLAQPGAMQQEIGMAQEQRPMDNLNRYWGIVGANNWGGTQTTEGTSTTKGKESSGGFGFSLG